MLQFVCDSCGNVKTQSETWVVGLAAEAVGVVSARKEVTILSTWDRANTLHPLAVHFCSLECKDDYMTRLFGPEAAPASREQVIAEIKPNRARRKKSA